MKPSTVRLALAIVAIAVVAIVSTRGPGDVPSPGASPPVGVATTRPSEATPAGPVGAGMPATVPPVQDVAPPGDAVAATVVDITDGDTLTLDVPAGGRGSSGRVRARLLRIDTPEVGRDGARSECGAEAATRRLSALAPPDSTLRIAWDVEPLDQYGRDLVHAWTDDGAWVNGQLLAEGMARVVTFPPNEAHDGAVRALEQAARNAAVGIWGAC